MRLELGGGGGSGGKNAVDIYEWNTIYDSNLLKQ